MLNILNYPVFFIMLVAITLSLVLTLVNKKLVDQNRLKEIQTRVNSYNKKLMKASKGQDQETLNKLSSEKPAIMQLQSEMMKMQLPVFASMLPFFLVFMGLRRLAVSMAWGEFIVLPFTVNFLSIGGSLSWLGWYIMCSFPFTSIFRKLLDVR